MAQCTRRCKTVFTYCMLPLARFFVNITDLHQVQLRPSQLKELQHLTLLLQRRKHNYLNLGRLEEFDLFGQMRSFPPVRCFRWLLVVNTPLYLGVRGEIVVLTRRTSARGGVIPYHTSDLFRLVARVGVSLVIRSERRAKALFSPPVFSAHREVVVKPCTRTESTHVHYNTIVVFLLRGSRGRRRCR